MATGNDAVADVDMSSSDSEAASALEPSLDAAMLNELLLVCSNLGMLRVPQEGEAPVLMRGEDCEQWIHDLQRALRRDHATHRLVTKQLGQWQILQKKLLPLLVHHQHDWPLVFSILKVLVMLTTKPPRDSSHVAQQLQYLRQYKHEFLRRQVVPILMAVVVEPLARTGAARTATDYLNMEIVLMLLRNLLAIPNEDPRYVTSTTAHLSHLQEDLIATLHEESAYEMLLLFAQDIDSAEHREWNLLIMEMLDLTLDCSQPQAVAAYAKKRLTGDARGDARAVQHADQAAGPTLAAGDGSTRAVARVGRGDLLDKLKHEKKASASLQLRSRRHSNFGGVLTVVGPTGRTTVVSDFTKPASDQVPQVAKKPTSRRRGKKSAARVTDIHEVFVAGKGKVTESDERTMRVLQDICDSIIAKSYFQLTNSLKTEFRRGSSKLIATDRLQYFHLVWFLTTYHRLKIQTLRSHYKHQLKAVQEQTVGGQTAPGLGTSVPPAPEKPDYGEKAVLSTLDMFSFNFVLQSIENYATMKNYHGMTVSVQLLTEMMAYLAELAASDDLRFQRIADSLQHKIFYERDFLDRLPVLLKTWSPGLFHKAYVVDVVTLTHLVLKVLDAQGTIKVLSRRKAYLDLKRKKKKHSDADGEDSGGSSMDEEETEQQAQTLMEMQRKEADFDVRKYFASMVSADTIRMYCSLLADYRDNSAKVNHYIHSFLYRTKLFRIHQQEEWTMQPMLFNIHVLLLFNKMLQDTYIQRLPEYKNFLDFIRSVVRDFFTLADKNNLLFVEALLRQTYPSKSCVLIQRSYDPIDSMSKSKSQAVSLGRKKQIEATNESRRHRTALDHEELEGEAEFQFTLEPSDFDSASVLNRKDKEDDESEAECDLTALSPNASASATRSRLERKALVSRAATERAESWSKVEDRYLAKVYMKFRHLPSVYDVISCEDMFQERDRTPEQIMRRAEFLKLHRESHDLSDGDGYEQSNSSGEQDEGQAGQKKTLDTTGPRRRLRRGADLSDDESDDDMLLRSRTSAPVDPLQSANTAATHGENVTDIGAVADIEMNGASLHAGSSNVTTPSVNDDVYKGQCQEDTRVVEDSIRSCGEYRIEQSAETQTARKPRNDADAAVSVTADVATAHAGAEAENTDEPAMVIAGLEAANINGSQDVVVPVTDTTVAQPCKRARTTENDECMEDTPAKKISIARE